MVACIRVVAEKTLDFRVRPKNCRWTACGKRWKARIKSNVKVFQLEQLVHWQCYLLRDDWIKEEVWGWKSRVQF